MIAHQRGIHRLWVGIVFRGNSNWWWNTESVGGLTLINKTTSNNNNRSSQVGFLLLIEQKLIITKEPQLHFLKNEALFHYLLLSLVSFLTDNV